MKVNVWSRIPKSLMLISFSLLFSCSRANYYYSQGEKTYFQIVSNKCALQLSNDQINALENLDVTTPSELNDGFSWYYGKNNFKTYNIIIVDNESKEAVTNSIQSLSPDVIQELAIVKFDDNSVAVNSNTVLLKFKNNISTQEIASLFLDLNIKESDIISSNEYGRYKLKLDNLNPFVTANLLQESGLVTYAHPDMLHPITKSSNGCMTPSNNLENWHHNLLGTQAVFDSQFYGDADVEIAYIDDGFVVDHVEFYGKQIGQRSTSSSGYVATPFHDSHTHGTPMAGAGVAGISDGNLIYGTCPSCSLLAIQINQSLGSLSDVLYGLVSSSTLSVINISWSMDTYESDLIEALRLLSTNGRNGKGTLIMKSVGNDPHKNIMDTLDLAGKDFVTTITGSKSDDYFNTGYTKCNSISFAAPSSDIAAPGFNISDYNDHEYYDTANQTSGATAIASGIAGLVLSQNPLLSRKTVLGILENSAIKITADNFATTYGNYNVVYDADGVSEYTGFGRISACSLITPFQSVDYGASGDLEIKLASIPGIKHLFLRNVSQTENTLIPIYESLNFVVETSINIPNTSTSNYVIEAIDSLEKVYVIDVPAIN